jgi:prepilin-type N-terminal cleavage/methylation domain-containing protein
MRVLHKRLGARRKRYEEGFTLPELLIGMTIGLVVLGGAATVFSAAIHSQSSIDTRSLQIQQARTTADQIVRELHQGATVSTASASSLTFVTYVHSATCGGAAASTAIACRVSYSCASGACTRTVRNTNGTGSAPAVTTVTGLASSSVFSYSPTSTSPRYVGVAFTFAPKSGQNGVTVNDGAALGNVPAS